MATEPETQSSTERPRPSLGLILLGLFLILMGAYVFSMMLHFLIVLRSVSQNLLQSFGMIPELGVFCTYAYSMMLFLGFYCIILGFKVLQLKAWTYRTLLLITAPNIFFPLNTFFFFGPRVMRQTLSATVSIAAAVFWLLVFFFVSREKTRKQLRYGPTFTWWSVPGMCVVAWFVLAISPAVLVVGYKAHLARLGVPFWPISNEVYEVSEKDSIELEDCQEVHFAKFCFPIRKDLRLFSFAEKEELRRMYDFVVLLRKKEDGQQGQMVSLNMNSAGGFDSWPLHKMVRAKNTYEAAETVMTANWSLFPLFARRMLERKTIRIYSRETDNLKVIAAHWERPKMKGSYSMLSVTLYVPGEDISRQLDFLVRDGKIFGYSVPAILSKLEYTSEAPEGDVEPCDGAEDLRMLEKYMNDPTTENAVILAERLIDSDTMHREDLERFLDHVMIKDPDNKKVAELLSRIRE